MISNVFSVTTLAVNIVPSTIKILSKPAIHALLENPFEKATRQEVAATYSAMAMALKSAWGASKEAYRYEQSLITRDSNRLLEGQMAIKGVKGGVIRLFPRLLSASDEFMSRVTYEGYVAGRKIANAYAEGEAKGLSGKALKDYAKAESKKALQEAYTSGRPKDNLQIILNKGQQLGKEGEDLVQYVRKEYARGPKHLSAGTDREAMDYVRDALYKRKFSGETTDVTGLLPVSWAAQKYEEWTNKAPIMRLAGQLFFRTPIRVFEEGIRLTPGVQILAPGFLKDLAGKNGRGRQVRAQSESLMSLALAGHTLMLYAEGRITGDGAYSDWKQQRARGDSDLPEPYTIKFADGSTWSYRNFDPIATPMKIIVNGLERYEKLSMRKRQGEFIGKSDWDKALAAVTVGTSAITQAIRDANLMAGIDGLMKLGEGAADPEESGAFLKLMGEKLRTLVPNTLHKIARTNDPTIDDPATFWQIVESKVLDFAPTGITGANSAKSYDVLGNVRQVNDTGALWNIFSESTPTERGKGRSDKELFVMSKLDELSHQTESTFALNPIDKRVGDLREHLTADGKETLWDRINKVYKSLHPEEGLYQILSAQLPVGTVSINGAAVTEARKFINQLHEAAFYQVMTEDAGLFDTFKGNVMRKAEVQAGFWDANR